MSRPKKIQILNLTYTIRWVDSAIEVGSDAQGWCDFSNQLIVINKDNSKQVLKEVFLHEVFHALFYARALMEPEAADHEQMVTRMATGCCTIWEQNPKAFKWWEGLA